MGFKRSVSVIAGVISTTESAIRLAVMKYTFSEILPCKYGFIIEFYLLIAELLYAQSTSMSKCIIFSQR